MTRHGKNATASSVYSYHEKKKDAEQSKYGTRAGRLGKDSVKVHQLLCSKFIKLQALIGTVGIFNGMTE